MGQPQRGAWRRCPASNVTTNLQSAGAIAFADDGGSYDMSRIHTSLLPVFICVSRLSHWICFSARRGCGRPRTFIARGGGGIICWFAG